MIVNKGEKKENLPNCELCRPGRPQNGNKRKRKKRLASRPGKRIKKYTEHEGDGDTNCGWCTGNNPQRIAEGTGRLGNKRTSRDRPDYSIIKTVQNTEKRHEETCCHSNFSEKPSANAGVKNSQGVDDNLLLL